MSPRRAQLPTRQGASRPCSVRVHGLGRHRPSSAGHVESCSAPPGAGYCASHWPGSLRRASNTNVNLPHRSHQPHTLPTVRRPGWLRRSPTGQGVAVDARLWAEGMVPRRLVSMNERSGSALRPPRSAAPIGPPGVTGPPATGVGGPCVKSPTPVEGAEEFLLRNARRCRALSVWICSPARLD
jgi:hypothetical protein